MLVKARSNTYERSHECFSEIILELGGKKEIDRDIIMLIAEQESKVIKEAESLEIPNNRTPFIPVFSPNYLSIEKQLSLIEDPRGDYFSEIKLKEVSDIARDVPDSPFYFIFGIEDGRETENEKFYSAMKNIVRMNMSLLTLAEMISVAIFTESLEKRNLWALESRHKDGMFPLLKTNGSGPVKKLIWASPVVTLKNSGIPSCITRKLI